MNLGHWDCVGFLYGLNVTATNPETLMLRFKLGIQKKHKIKVQKRKINS